MDKFQLCRYITMLTIMEIVTIDIVIYAIVKMDFSKQIFRLMKNVFIRGAIILIVFMMEVLYEKPIPFF